MNEIPFVYALCQAMNLSYDRFSGEDCIDGCGVRIDVYDGCMFNWDYYWAFTRWETDWKEDRIEVSYGLKYS